MLEISKPQWQQKLFKHGNTIISDLDHLWLINQGIVKTRTWNEEGRAIVLGYWGMGDVVGQYLSRINPYEIKCLTPVRATCVHREYWHYLSKELRRHQQDTEELLYIFRHKSLRQKVIKSLIFLVRKFGIESHNEKTKKIYLTHQELADFIGSNRPGITKTINELEREGSIERPDRSAIVLHNNLIKKSI
ncbi:Crp/Fnr family transcriptional regulator [Myxosarcina sp. GI1]|uniref:Crp/Fnr family transcriptional regulator n=1 Tax=Myxosarcina sp. GI1 TaxID=1541065 RepID=UPI000567289B|nr:Crp/Fnr family transcriptional regulator [Myxosarcina sp. GI1]